MTPDSHPTLREIQVSCRHGIVHLARFTLFMRLCCGRVRIGPFAFPIGAEPSIANRFRTVLFSSLERFPGARFVATSDVVKIMRQQESLQSLASFWNPRFPGQISDHLVIAEELTESVIDLEGHDVVAVPLGHTDTVNTTCLHVPSIGLVVAGDAAYNGVHLHLAESDPQTRREWIAALDTIEAFKPRAVIAGHKRAENDDSPKIIEETRQYIRDFDRVAGTTTTARELYDKMLELHPNRVNPGALWNSARAIKPQKVVGGVLLDPKT